MGMFYLVVVGRTDRSGGKYWAGPRMHRLAGLRELCL